MLTGLDVAPELKNGIYVPHETNKLVFLCLNLQFELYLTYLYHFIIKYKGSPHFA
jgi:hypothetical protein